MSNEIPVTHWKPILNFYVLNEKVDFERKGIPGEIYPFIRYDESNTLYKDVIYKFIPNWKPWSKDECPSVL